MDNKILSKSFLWMMFGLLVTFITGYLTCTSPRLLIAIFGNGLYYLLAIVEFLLVVYLSARVTRMSETTAKIMFLLYSFVSGLTFSSIFIVYNIASIIYVFLISAAVYGIMAFIGYSTRIDLSKIGTYFLFGMIGVIIASIINIFVGGTILSLIITIAVLILFLGVTAYDVQKIKSLPVFDAAPIYGALELYLDFINIFISLLRLFGKNRD